MFCVTMTSPAQAASPVAAKQQQMRDPHGKQHDGAERARAGSPRRRSDCADSADAMAAMPVSPATERRNWSRIEPVPWPISGASAINPIDFLQNSSRSPARVRHALRLKVCAPRCSRSATLSLHRRAQTTTTSAASTTAAEQQTRASLPATDACQANSSSSTGMTTSAVRLVRDVEHVGEKRQGQQRQRDARASAAAPATPSARPAPAGRRRR